jgi:hypothetical protein
MAAHSPHSGFVQVGLTELISDSECMGQTGAPSTRARSQASGEFSGLIPLESPPTPKKLFDRELRTRAEVGRRIPEIDWESAGDYARKNKKTAFLCEGYRRCYLHSRLSDERAVSLRNVLAEEPAQSERARSLKDR